VDVTTPSATDWLTAIGTILPVVVALLIAFLGAIQANPKKLTSTTKKRLQVGLMI